MPTEHEGLPVRGYQAQSQQNIDLANEGKVLEEQVLRWLDRLQTQGTYTADGAERDPRMVALGRTNIQQGFMWAVRSIFQPKRIELDEDGNAQ